MTTRTPAFVWVGLDCICCWTISTNWVLCVGFTKKRSAEDTTHSDPNWSILSNNKYNPGQPIQKLGFWLSSRPFCIRTTFIWVHQGPPVIVPIFFSYTVIVYNVIVFAIRPVSHGWWCRVLPGPPVDPIFIPIPGGHFVVVVGRLFFEIWNQGYVEVWLCPENESTKIELD